ncbi:hypothetical protein SAMN05660649_03142 [Desulfotomaculum arcticum]|uniref:Uncharacterized protein n=1 Tax=Desulfotruncus arcticus DSM 17038 TaxID=1121424 RepID=A0A1I2VT13_9FIRM|nr:hypothetical protein [Desulfotruncus arcticus]SFG92368.1 hypothetical protein SAMN05660649_03142 [Desulfotomaculum arcticum] [Desulfotruncus arcticus DSM 17038]
MKCPYCKIKFNSLLTLNVHKESCLYKDNPVQVDYEAIPYLELKSMVMSKGMDIKVANKKKTEIIEVLKEMED